MSRNTGLNKTEKSFSPIGCAIYNRYSRFVGARLKVYKNDNGKYYLVKAETGLMGDNKTTISQLMSLPTAVLA